MKDQNPSHEVEPSFSIVAIGIIKNKSMLFSLQGLGGKVTHSFFPLTAHVGGLFFRDTKIFLRVKENVLLLSCELVQERLEGLVFLDEGRKRGA